MTKNKTKKQDSSNLSNNVNDDFIELFREKLRVLFKEFNELVQKDEYRGGKHVLFGQIFDTFAVDESTKEKGGIIQWIN